MHLDNSYNAVFSMPPKSKGSVSNYTSMYTLCTNVCAWVCYAVPMFLLFCTASDDKLGKGVWEQGCYIDCIHVIHIVSGTYHYYSLPLFRPGHLDTEVSKIEQSAPFLVWTGTAGDENAQFYVCCEQSVLTESKTVRDAVIDLMATYYVFDIAYPKTVCAMMLFFSTYCF